MPNEATDKRFISKIYKQLMYFSIKKKIIQSKSWQKIYKNISPKKTYR